ncbi:MAG: hypothetical protein JNK14_20400 [Chitinophagaceae bacterium]|nr:hypothetical protein [Chitinophagaceae bacterium]
MRIITEGFSSFQVQQGRGIPSAILIPVSPFLVTIKEFLLSLPVIPLPMIKTGSVASASVGGRKNNQQVIHHILWKAIPRSEWLRS